MFIVTFFSCQSHKKIDEFIRNEINENSRNGFKSVLIKEKANLSVLISIYSKNNSNNNNPLTGEFWMKIFDKTDLEINKYKYNYYSEVLNWTQSQSNNLGFEKKINFKELSALISNKLSASGSIKYYIISEPFFNTKKNEFIVYKEINELTKNSSSNEILKFIKEKGRWVLKENYKLKVIGLHE